MKKSKRFSLTNKNSTTCTTYFSDDEDIPNAETGEHCYQLNIPKNPMERASAKNPIIAFDRVVVDIDNIHIKKSGAKQSYEELAPLIEEWLKANTYCWNIVLKTRSGYHIYLILDKYELLKTEEDRNARRELHKKYITYIKSELLKYFETKGVF